MDQIKLINPVRRFKAIEEEYRVREDSVYKSGKFFEYEQTNELSEKLKLYTGYDYVVLTSSGTASLYVMGVYFRKWFSKIMTTPYTYIATHNAFKRSGYELSFTNINKFMLGDFSKCEINKDYLYVPVGIYGKQPNFPENVTVLEDACQNWILSKSKHNKAISFDSTKNISSNGNGGAILTNDKDLFEFARKFIMVDVERVGLNLRMSELECAYVIPQLTNIIDNQEKRRKVAKIYNSVFKSRALYQLEEDHDLQKYIIRSGDIYFDTSKIEVRNYYKNTGLGLDLLGIPIYPELTNEEITTITRSWKSR